MAASTPSTRSKLFVLDTNVILHDAGCLWNFKEHDIAVPITVLEELDRFKKGNEDINFQARAFLRRLDDLTSDVLSDDGTSLGPGLGKIRVVLKGDHGDELKKAFFSDAPDHRILDISLTLQDLEQPRSVILVTKDTNLRLKAKSMGLPAQDYNSDKVESFDKLYTGKRQVTDLPSELISEFFINSGYVGTDRLPMVEEPIANENFILRNGSKSVLATYHATEKKYSRLEKVTAAGVTPRNAEQSFALSALMDDSIKLVTIGGKAGSGKTLLAMAAALECRSRYRQTLLARPVVPLSNRDLGFLPGDINAKLDPYMQPLYDNLSVMCAHLGESDVRSKLDDLLVKYKLEVTPLAYIRGRSLQRVFFIVDEAQNLTPHEVKTIITRAGEGTKIVLTGDPHQIDNPYVDHASNGLSVAADRFKRERIAGHIVLAKGERSELAELAANLL